MAVVAKLASLSCIAITNLHRSLSDLGARYRSIYVIQSSEFRMSASNLLLFLGVVCAASLVRVIHCQDACERITTDDLGRSDMLENSGLVATALTPTGEAGNVVDVRILDVTIICEAQHEMQDRYRYTSVVVSFNCLTTDARVSECNDSSAVLTEQYDFGCTGGAWSRNILTVTTAARTANPTATLSTGLDTGCILCINPSNPEAAFLPSPVDSVTHCVGEFLDTIVSHV